MKPYLYCIKKCEQTIYPLMAQYCDKKQTNLQIVSDKHGKHWNFSQIEIVFLSPNTTSVMQPCDAGIIYSFKRHYRQRYLQKIIRQIDSEEKDVNNS